MAYHTETALPQMAQLKTSGPSSPNFSAGSSFPVADFTRDEFILSGLLPDASYRLAMPIDYSYDRGEPIVTERSSGSPANLHDCFDAQQSLSLWLPTLEADVQQPAVATLRGRGHTDRGQAAREQARQHQKRHRERQKVIRLMDLDVVVLVVADCQMCVHWLGPCVFLPIC